MNTVKFRILPPILAAACIAHMGLALADVTTNISSPLRTRAFVPCANNGSGEIIDLTGDLHTLLILNVINSGNVTMKYHYNPQGVIGIGETTGNRYQGTGVTQSISTFEGISFPFETTYVNNYRLIGQGSEANYSVHTNMHLTINANGTATATVEHTDIDCR